MVSRDQRATLLLFVGCAALLSLIGIIFIYSASSIFALEKFGIAHYFVQRQIWGTICGIICALVVAQCSLSTLAAVTPLVFLGSLGLTTLIVIVPSLATVIHGSARWITIAGVSLQPTEILKVATIMMLARIMSMPSFAKQTFLKSSIPIIALIAPVALILLAQPDFGQTALLVGTTFSMLALAHPNISYLWAGIGSALLGGIGLILWKPYRLKRITTFLHPWDDPQGAGFQIIQSLIAIGSGGLTGIGIGKSQQKFFYLPMQHTDFIFSIIAEETGFLGASLLILIYLMLLYSGIRLAWHLKSNFAMLSVCGIVTMITLQTIINLAVATGLAPTKGIGLPFVSYGLSSLIAHGLMIGIVIACVQHDRT